MTCLPGAVWRRVCLSGMEEQSQPRLLWFRSHRTCLSLGPVCYMRSHNGHAHPTAQGPLHWGTGQVRPTNCTELQPPDATQLYNTLHVLTYLHMDYGSYIIHITSVFGHTIPTLAIMMHPNIEVMCIIKFQYATSAWLALPYDHCLVSLLFPYMSITVVEHYFVI